MSQKPIMASAGGGAAHYPPPPQGSYVAVCCDVVDLGVIETTFQNETKKKHCVRLYWQIDETREDGKPYIVSKRYTLSMHERASLRKDLESWRGRQYAAAELPFDLQQTVGKSCLLGIMHRVNGDTTYANVTSLMPLPRGTKPIAVDPTFVRKADRDPNATDGGADAAVHEESTEVYDEDLIPF